MRTGLDRPDVASFRAFFESAVQTSYPVSVDAVVCPLPECGVGGTLQPVPLEPRTRKKWAMRQLPPVVAKCNKCLTVFTSNEVVRTQVEAVVAKHGIPSGAVSDVAIDDIIRGVRPISDVATPPSLLSATPGYDAVQFQAAFRKVVKTLILLRTTCQTHTSTHRGSCFKASVRNGNRADVCRYLFPFDTIINPASFEATSTGTPEVCRYIGAEFLNAWNGECFMFAPLRGCNEPSNV